MDSAVIAGLNYVGLLRVRQLVRASKFLKEYSLQLSRIFLAETNSYKNI